MRVPDGSVVAPPAEVGPDERRVLYQIIRTVSSSVDLEEVLRAVVRLIVEGVRAQSCFVWIVEGGGRLVLRAASEQYAPAVGRATLARGEGFAGWVVEHGRPIFLPADALADPRARYFPEFEEERYQSMVSVPLVGKDGEVFGVIGIHSPAPRDLTEDDARFVEHSASLVAGAVENARLYEVARRRVEALERLAELSVRAAGAATVADLIPTVVDAARALLSADAVAVFAGEGGEARLLAVVGAWPGEARDGADATAAGAAEGRLLEAPIEADGVVLGRLLARRVSGPPFDDADLDLAHGIAAQTAVGLKKIQLIERLTERHRIQELFAALEAGQADAAAAAGRRLALDLEARHVAVVASASSPGEAVDLARLARSAASLHPDALFDVEGESVRGLLPIADDGIAEATAALGGLLRTGPTALPVVIGVGGPFSGAAAASAALRQARDAVRVAPLLAPGPGVVPYDELGPAKYLLHVPSDPTASDRHRAALRRLHEYDRRRRASLTATLAEFMARRGNSRATAQALRIHDNTLRQRLDRIREVSGLDLRREDWLTVQIALQLLRLEELPPGD